MPEPVRERVTTATRERPTTARNARGREAVRWLTCSACPRRGSMSPWISPTVGASPRWSSTLARSSSLATRIHFAGAPIRWPPTRAASAMADSRSRAATTRCRSGCRRTRSTGLSMHRGWGRVDAATIETELGPDWPFAGRVVQHFALESRRFAVRMELQADEPMPASIGWHPWFLRRPRDVGGPASQRRR